MTDVDPQLAVLRSNYGTRDVTPGQKAMAFAMSVPSDKRGMGALSRIRDNEMSKTEKNLISLARYVRKNNPIPEGKEHPQVCRDVMDGLISLTEAHETTKRDVAIRESEEAIRKENAEKLADVRIRYPNLAALVDDERLTLAQAIASAEQSDRDEAEEVARLERAAAEKARREQEEADRLQAGALEGAARVLSAETFY